MSLSALIRTLIVWIVFIPVPIINGVVREQVYRPIVGEIAANQISTVILTIIFLIYVFFFLKSFINKLSFINTLFIGFIWILLTVIFEFVFGHFIDHVSWQKLIENYNVLKGNWWSIFLVVEFISPSLVKLLVGIKK
jgi:hypothetical protein